MNKAVQENIVNEPVPLHWSVTSENVPMSSSLLSPLVREGAVQAATREERLPDLVFLRMLAPEAEFIVLSSRTQLKGVRRARWEELLKGSSTEKDAVERPLDWKLVLRLASAHRVLGLLGRHLSTSRWEGVPDFVVRDVQRYFHSMTVHSTALRNELVLVSHHLEAIGIPVVSFKGTTLGVAAYGNAVVRPSSDIDLLVSRHDAVRARDALRDLGYSPEAELSQMQEKAHLREDSVFNLVRPTPPSLSPVFPSGFATELHWGITSPCLPFDFDFESVNDRLTWMQLPGVEPSKASVRAFLPEDLLLILCVHGSKHLWERLIWLCDISELLAANPSIDWDWVIRNAISRGIKRMTALGLVLARDVLGVLLPAEVENWLSTQPQVLRLASELRHALIARSNNHTSYNGQLSGHDASSDRLLIQTIDVPWKRIGFLWHVATVPTMGERATFSLPPGFDFLWRILKPTHAAQKRLIGRKANRSL